MSSVALRQPSLALVEVIADFRVVIGLSIGNQPHQGGVRICAETNARTLLKLRLTYRLRMNDNHNTYSACSERKSSGLLFPRACAATSRPILVKLIANVDRCRGCVCSYEDLPAVP